MSADERQSDSPVDERADASAPTTEAPASSTAPSRTGIDPAVAAREAQLTEWMQAAQKGDADAYRRLLGAIQPMIRGIVRAKVRDEAAAEDVVQNTLLSIHRGRRTYRAERPFGPWMRAITRNTIIDHFRERKRKGDREVELVVEEFADEHEGSAEADTALAPELTAALAALPDSQREAVTLVQIEGLSVAEAALRAGVSAGALKVRAHRGYRALAKALEGARVEGEWKSERPRAARGEGGSGESR
ncbi:MAG: sigma-70 family RNA polymerase sigma factor [bacterium]|nr:sigma-70 family RNA polymerase sigma factor [bacterium]